MFYLTAAKSDPGVCRETNEDSFCLAEGLSLYMVADGMGGHAAGEVASRMAVEMICGHIERARFVREPFSGKYREELHDATNRLASAVRLANEAIFRASLENPAWHGMGTTLAAIRGAGDRVGIVHVGDSRVYLIRKGGHEQITDDHTLVSEQMREGLLSAEEAERSPMKNYLTRALGQREMVDVDLREVTVRSGDRLLICTDGLTNMVPEDVLLATVRSTSSPRVACRRLVEMANRLGGKDNITVVMMYCCSSRLLLGARKLLERFRRR